MELNFIKCGDYYIPDIKLEKPNIRLGKWGRMRREYLRWHTLSLSPKWCCLKHSIQKT